MSERSTTSSTQPKNDCSKFIQKRTHQAFLLGEFSAKETNCDTRDGYGIGRVQLTACLPAAALPAQSFPQCVCCILAKVTIMNCWTVCFFMILISTCKCGRAEVDSVSVHVLSQHAGQFPAVSNVRFNRHESPSFLVRTFITLHGGKAKSSFVFPCIHTSFHV